MFKLNIFGTQSQRILKGVKPIVDKINAFEPEISKLSDDEMTLMKQHTVIVRHV